MRWPRRVRSRPTDGPQLVEPVREDDMCRGLLLSLAAVLFMTTSAAAQMHRPEAAELAPTGKLRVGVLMLSYFAVKEGDELKGWSPDMGNELARQLGVPAELVPIHNPANMIDAFKTGSIDVTFIGITKDRAA